MKVAKIIANTIIVLAAIAGAVYVAITYGEQIVAWCKKVLASLPCCKGDDCECCCGGDCDCDEECCCGGDCDCDEECCCGEECCCEEAAEEIAEAVEEIVEEIAETDFEN